MLVKSRNLFRLRPENQANKVPVPDHHMDNQRPSEFKTADSFGDFKYNISKAKLLAERWKNFINIFGWCLNAYGSYQIILIIDTLINYDEKQEKEK